MSPPNNSQSESPNHHPHHAEPPSPGQPINGSDSAKLAHELANLLDGSLRNVSLVISHLAQTETVESPEEDVLRKLHVANGAMKQMAKLIHTWMGPRQSTQAMPGNEDSPTGQVEAYHWQGTLGQAIKHALELIGPQAEQSSIQLITDVAQQVACLPCGPVFPVIANALRNSVEAIAAAQHDGQCIELSARIVDGHVCIRQTDTGIGLDPAIINQKGELQFGRSTKPDGHGLGLMLSRDIMRSLGGELQLTNNTPCGAVLSLRYPVAAVNHQAQ